MSHPVATTRYRVMEIIEPFRHYSADWRATYGRTDTPDLLGFFRRFEEETLMAEGYEETAEEERQLAEGDMAAGFETLPD